MSVYPNAIEMIFYPYWKYIMWIKFWTSWCIFWCERSWTPPCCILWREGAFEWLCMQWYEYFNNLFKYFPIRCVVQIFFHQMRKLIRLLNNFWNLALFCNIGEGNAFHNAVNIFPKWLNQFADNGQFVCDIGAFNALLVVIILHVLLAA